MHLVGQVDEQAQRLVGDALPREVGDQRAVLADVLAVQQVRPLVVLQQVAQVPARVALPPSGPCDHREALPKLCSSSCVTLTCSLSTACSPMRPLTDCVSEVPKCRQMQRMRRSTQHG